MSLPEYFISCDWGTTNFRLRLVETHGLKVLEVRKTDQGIKTLYDQFTEQQQLSQTEFFSKYLKGQIQFLPEEHQNHLVVLSGMASSNIGLRELDYADMPFDQSGNELVWKNWYLNNGIEVLLISGVKSESGMMRGEETQAIGLTEILIAHGDGILLLPGTHSKHLAFSKSKFTGLKNYMTGELFEVLSSNSILANSVTAGNWNRQTQRTFHEGLALGLSGKLTSSLLSIRARQVIHNSSKEENYYLLSGLLIGDELSYLANYTDCIFLAAPASVSELYQVALEEILDDQQIIQFDESILEQALLAGQKKILESNVK